MHEIRELFAAFGTSQGAFVSYSFCIDTDNDHASSFSRTHFNQSMKEVTSAGKKPISQPELTTPAWRLSAFRRTVAAGPAQFPR